MTFAKIIGTGIYVPEKIVTNDDLSKILGEDINEFVSRILGIQERHVCAEDESTADLATNASLAALKAAHLDARELDLIVLATDTPEQLSPATSVVVQHRLGASNAGTFDVNSACAGFVTALDTAAKFIIADSAYRNVLVVGAYAMSKYLDLHDKKTATIFADGAGALVLQASDDGAGFLAGKLHADGSFHDHMGIYAGGTHLPITKHVIDEGIWNKVRFAKKYPAEVNTEGWPAIKLFLFTQVNLSTIKEVMSKLDLPMERTHTIMHKWGYTGSACIPMVLHDAVQAGRLERGDNVIMCASGGGLNMACVAFKW
jgi:3-oxoacyl-[acyl-carrier-protein] synthase-3